MSIPTYHGQPQESGQRRVWRIVAHAPLDSLWHVDGCTKKEIASRTWKAIRADRVFARAAELGFYFFFALFPALFCAVSIFGIVVKSAHQIYGQLLGYVSIVAPPSALHIVMSTFNETTKAATSGKITYSLIGAVWSASIGISAIQDTLNDVYKIQDTRSYLGARLKAIGLTFVVTAMITISLGSIFGAGFVGRYVQSRLTGHFASVLAATGTRVAAWMIATLLLMLVFAVIYYWAPEWRRRRWRWFTPGSTIGVGGWLISSIGLRVYMEHFDTYTVTYGSLGAVIILLMWFYITGFMLLVGGEINGQIEAASVEKRLKAHRNRTGGRENAA